MQLCRVIRPATSKRPGKRTATIRQTARKQAGKQANKQANKQEVAAAKRASNPAAHRPLDGRSMQLPVDLLSERQRDALDARQILDARRHHAAQAAESREQPLAALRAHAFEFFEA
jgi:hypothetical protein